MSIKPDQLGGPYREHKAPTWAVVVACGALAAACGAPSAANTTTTPAAAPANTASAQPNGTSCVPETAVGDIIVPPTPKQVSTLLVLAGIAELPDGEYIGHPVLTEGAGNQWDVATLSHVGGLVWKIADAVPLSDVNVFTRQQATFSTTNDGCLPSSGIARPPLGQIVTATGQVDDLSTGVTYPGFKNGGQRAATPRDGFLDGAIGEEMPDLPIGFGKAPASQFQLAG